MTAGCVFTAHSMEKDKTQWLRDTLPDHWELEQHYFQTTPSADKWWNEFNDDILSDLIKRAESNNYNVQAAQQRIKSAAQMSRATKAGYYPTFDVSAGYGRDMSAGAIVSRHTPSSTESYFSLGLSMNWEIDIFGRISAQLKSDKANYNATVAEYDATLVSLVSNLAKAYFQLRMAQSQYAIAVKNIGVSEELLHLAQTRYDVGLNPSIDVVQAEITLMQTKATLPALQADITTYLNEVALLVGVYPDQLQHLLEVKQLPSAPMPGMVGEPSSLLRRRPDVVEAEQELAKMAAAVGIAKKDFLPTLSLTAGVGTEAHNLKDLFGKNSLYYSIIPTLSWTIFDGMSRNAQLAEARYNLEAEIDSYNLTVMTAVQEVNNAMVSWESVTEQLAYDREILNKSQRALELQIDRYTQGLNNFNDVAEAQAEVLSYENGVVAEQAAQLAAIVTLYTAFGGGF